MATDVVGEVEPPGGPDGARPRREVRRDQAEDRGRGHDHPDVVAGRRRVGMHDPEEKARKDEPDERRAEPRGELPLHVAAEQHLLRPRLEQKPQERQRQDHRPGRRRQVRQRVVLDGPEAERDREDREDHPRRDDEVPERPDPRPEERPRRTSVQPACRGHRTERHAAEGEQKEERPFRAVRLHHRLRPGQRVLATGQKEVGPRDDGDGPGNVDREREDEAEDEPPDLRSPPGGFHETVERGRHARGLVRRRAFVQRADGPTRDFVGSDAAPPRPCPISATGRRHSPSLKVNQLGDSP